jgi:transporter family-2 protein
VSLTASLLTSIILDQFGMIGFKPHPLSTMRAAGAAFLIAGVWMIARS